jgi:hypothetical protein
MTMRALTLLACAGAACSDAAPTRVQLAVTSDPAWAVDQLELRAGDHNALASLLPELELQLPDEMAGHDAPLKVWGLAAGQQVAYGMTSITPVLHHTIHAAVDLQSITCGLFCMEGEVECSDNGVATCAMRDDGCLDWSTPMECPSATPFCSNGACSAQCADECTSGQTECDTSAAVRMCGQYDADPCLEWSPPMACGSGKMCVAGACTGTTTCPDGDGCDDGNACTIADTCHGGACSGMPKCTSAPPNADPACSNGTCGFTCHAGYMPLGNHCAPVGKLVFLTSAMYDGNLGGLSGADAKCAALAAAAGLPGTFRSWLSGADSSFTHSTVPYRLVDGTEVAANWNGLSGSLMHAIDKDEHGAVIADGYAWTQTTAYGQHVQSSIDAENCVGWTSNASSTDPNDYRHFGWVGNADAVDASWSCDVDATLGCTGSDFCVNSDHLFCFQQ